MSDIAFPSSPRDCDEWQLLSYETGAIYIYRVKAVPYRAEHSHWNWDYKSGARVGSKE